MDLDAGDSPWGDEPSRSVTTSAAPEQDSQDNGVLCPWKTSIAINPSLIAARSLLAAPAHPAPSAGSAEVRTPGRRVPRGTRKISAHATRLEAVDNTVDPLGPLGESTPDIVATPTEEAPAPPQKESLAARGPQPASTFAQIPGATGLADSVHLEEDGAGFRGPPPVQPPADVDGPKRQTHPSMSIEQAAKPTFDISVGDPHKVGDLTSSHIVYQVRTKTTSKGYRQPEFAVSRRYRDFLWLYNSLHNSNPGVVVAPPPEKQAHDGDLKIFLESEAFNVDIKNKENREPDLGQSKGMFSGFGISVGGGGKFVEHDDWFHDRKVYLDALENQLKALLKSMDTVVAQRKGLSEAAGDFSSSLHALAAVELSPALASPLDGLSELQFRIKELYERQAQQDVLTLGITIDEYIRLIGSVKNAFSQRQKAFHSWHAAESDLQKRKNTQEKLLRQGKSQQDRLNQANADVADAERKVHQTRLLFEDMGRLMRNELQRFEKEKVEDFKSGVETFLESAVEAQKELIELWETFLLRLDAGEDGLPYYVPESEAGQAPVSESTTSAAEPTAATEDEDEA
ncbi:Vacuolar protein sorting-associated protein vps5 [Penicillium subrubescens]|uniref:Vacuolar protein sorting-associated protein vps5 n=1 Tax=Penicillium subrubescens TaxID=1316194 RepID=A0A1Q5SXJ2_9EURO|nr:Vacuolar protein sorting-associated protein vps5 [Penicillium subrubescens]